MQDIQLNINGKIIGHAKTCLKHCNLEMDALAIARATLLDHLKHQCKVFCTRSRRSALPDPNAVLHIPGNLTTGIIEILRLGIESLHRLCRQSLLRSQPNA